MLYSILLFDVIVVNCCSCVKIDDDDDDDDDKGYAILRKRGGERMAVSQGLHGVYILEDV